MESHLEFEVYGLILYLAFLFAEKAFRIGFVPPRYGGTRYHNRIIFIKTSAWRTPWHFVEDEVYHSRAARISPLSTGKRYHGNAVSLQLMALHRNGGYRVSGFIQKMATVIF